MLPRVVALTQCGRCAWAGLPAGAASAAWVLVFGHADADEVLRTVEARVVRCRSRHGAVVYCEQCVRMTWLCGCHCTTQGEALQSHAELFERVGWMYAPRDGE